MERRHYIQLLFLAAVLATMLVFHQHQRRSTGYRRLVDQGNVSQLRGGLARSAAHATTTRAPASYSGVTDALGINKPHHPLVGYNTANRLVQHDPLVLARPYLPYGHLQKRFDGSGDAGKRAPPVSFIPGFECEVGRVGATSEKADVLVNVRTPIFDGRCYQGTRRSDTVLNRGEDPGKLLTRPPVAGSGGVDAFDVRPERISVTKPDRVDWRAYPGLANQSPTGVILSLGDQKR